MTDELNKELPPELPPAPEEQAEAPSYPDTSPESGGQAELNGSDPILWTGRPSHWVQIVPLSVCIIVGLLVFPLGYLARSQFEMGWGPLLITSIIWIVICAIVAGWHWLSLVCEKFELSEQRLKHTTGVLSKTTSELELYRVRDSELRRPLFMRLVGLGKIYLATSDRSHPEVDISGIKDAEAVRELIREQVEVRRRATRTREVDFE